MKRVGRIWIIAASLFLAAPANAQSGAESGPETCRRNAPCCAHCGRQCDCRPGYQLVCEMKDVKKTVYDYECKPGRAVRLACNKDRDSGASCPDHPSAKPDSDAHCTAADGPQEFSAGGVLALLGPDFLTLTCGRPICVKSLVKKEVTVRQQPVYKCVACCLCADCYPGCTQQVEAAQSQRPGAHPALEKTPLSPAPLPPAK